MSGTRPLFLSPKLADGMTSEAIEESGLNVCMFAIGRGSGAAPRFESVTGDANEPSVISILKSRQYGGSGNFQNIWQHYSSPQARAQSHGRSVTSILPRCVRNASPHRPKAVDNLSSVR